MAPKKGKKGPMLIDGVDTSTMNRDQLEAFALRLKAEMEREREERNFFQLERDKIRSFWEITRGQLEEVTAELRQKDHAVELAQELADIETKQVMQQMKHLQYENQAKVSEIRVESMAHLKLAQEEHLAMEQQILGDKRELRRSLRERDETYELHMQQLKMKQNEELADIRMNFERELKDTERLHIEKMQSQKAELELVYRMQMFEVEERKNTQIKRLIESHDTAYADMKNYYNDITLNNLGLITTLKEQMETLRKQSERSDRIAGEAMSENKRLKEPLELAQSELVELRRKLEHCDRDRAQLANLKVRHANTEKEMKSVKWETEVLLLRNETLLKEREELRSKFHEIVTELQQKTGLKNVLLERKLTSMEREMEKRDTMIKEIMTVCSKDEALTLPLKNLEGRVDDVLGNKNKTIKQLRYELVRISKAHDDLLDTYESKLEQLGIPKEQIGFKPLRFTSEPVYLCGPAGLVAKNN